MIKINNPIDRPAKVYQNNVLIGTINTQYQLNDIRLQVAKNKIDRVHFIFEREDGVKERIECRKDGSLSNWPQGFFDLIEHQLYAIVKIKREN